VAGWTSRNACTDARRVHSGRASLHSASLDEHLDEPRADEAGAASDNTDARHRRPRRAARSSLHGAEVVREVGHIGTPLRRRFRKEAEEEEFD